MSAGLTRPRAPCSSVSQSAGTQVGDRKPRSLPDRGVGTGQGGVGSRGVGEHRDRDGVLTLEVHDGCAPQRAAGWITTARSSCPAVTRSTSSVVDAVANSTTPPTSDWHAVATAVATRALSWGTVPTRRDAAAAP
ncbi:hypothetical protein [Pseudonocardia sp.]|uniref:hypothetical protein n=1 Tax=Pseudonocardia sp. TaxID=60912 RepID=UPI0031FDF62B